GLAGPKGGGCGDGELPVRFVVCDLHGGEIRGVDDQDADEGADPSPGRMKSAAVPTLATSTVTSRTPPAAAKAWSTMTRLAKPGGESMNGNSASCASVARPVRASGCELGTYRTAGATASRRVSRSAGVGPGRARNATSS